MRKGRILPVAINLGAAIIAVLGFIAWKSLNSGPTPVITYTAWKKLDSDPMPVETNIVREKLNSDPIPVDTYVESNIVWKKLDSDPIPVDTYMEGSTAVGLYQKELDDVGYIATANIRLTARSMAGSRALYEVTYTTGPDHFRIVPEAKQADRCVLLFGDSFTFGIGVNDDETYAAQIVIKSKGTVAVKSFGIGGWGPHQFLAGLQSGRFQGAVQCTPTDAVYLMIPSQIWRTVGVTNPWDTKGPRYRLDAHGRLFRDGVLGDPDNRRRGTGVTPVGKEDALKLAKAVIVEAMSKLKESYPGIRTHFISYRVASWDDFELSSDDLLRFEDQLRLAGITPLPLEAIIPQYRSASRNYILDPLDTHPNPLAHRLIAEFILREIKADLR